MDKKSLCMYIIMKPGLSQSWNIFSLEQSMEKSIQLTNQYIQDLSMPGTVLSDVKTIRNMVVKVSIIMEVSFLVEKIH